MAELENSKNEPIFYVNTMLMIKNELISSLIMSVIVGSLVWLNTPPNDQGRRTIATFIKAFIITFFITFVLFYFVSDPGTDEVIENIIKGKPDF